MQSVYNVSLFTVKLYFCDTELAAKPIELGVRFLTLLRLCSLMM